MRPAPFNRSIRLAVREVRDDVTGPEPGGYVPDRRGCVADMDQERHAELGRHGLCALNCLQGPLSQSRIGSLQLDANNIAGRCLQRGSRGVAADVVKGA